MISTGRSRFQDIWTKWKKIYIYKLPLFTLDSIYSTNASRAEQIPETNKLKPT